MDLEGLNELGRHVLSVFQEFESRFLGVATLEVTRPPERDGPVLSLRPERIGAARVEAEILQREVHLYVEGSEFAFQLRRREDPSALTDSVRQVLAAVTEGKFEKTVWEIRGRTLKSEGVVPDREHGRRHSTRMGLFSVLALPFARKRTTQYPPYR